MDDERDDCYCTVCGGPFRGLDFNNEPGPRLIGYDPDILNPEETRWTRDMYIVGRGGRSGIFLERGRYLHSSSKTIRVRLGPSPDQLLEFSCDPTDMDGDEYFPVHRSCLDLLCHVITGRRSYFADPDIIDTAGLHCALYALRNGLGGLGPHPNLLYLATCQADIWLSVPGFEMIVADPRLPAPGFDPQSNPVSIHLRSLISGGESTLTTRNYISPETAAELPAKVRSDPFYQLPLELRFSVSEYLDDQSLFTWCTASWAVHSALRVNDGFWRHRIARISMPWLEEIVPLLDDGELMDGVDVKGLLCWLERETEAYPRMEGPMMRVANRRRIWEVCEYIATVYNVVINTEVGDPPDSEMFDDSEEELEAISEDEV